MKNNLIMNKKLRLNIIFSLLLQLTTIICGFILPRIILSYFGSTVNGLVSSISQLLSIVSFLELGVGAVVQSYLYRPLFERNEKLVNEIISSGNNFFKKIAVVLAAYIVLLSLIFPFKVINDFDWVFTFLLVLAIGINSFSQFYFGVVDKLFLNADQRGYIQYISQIIALIINTILCVLFIKLGASIQLVKLTTSIIFLIRPLIIRIYVDKKYHIKRNVKYEVEPLSQKWNGIAQHISAVVLDNTDVVVLTLFSSLASVSIYSVYYLVVNGVKGLFVSFTAGYQSYLGALFAKNDKKETSFFFKKMEFLFNVVITFLFTITYILLIPFVKLYTSGINDLNYVNQLFSLLMVIAFALFCLRMPYHLAILAKSHYKETQSCYIVSAIINIVISCATVRLFGLIGVAIGTIVGTAYQTLWMFFWVKNKIIPLRVRDFIYQIFMDLIICICIYFSCSWIHVSSDSFISFCISAFEVMLIGFLATIICSLIMNFKLSVSVAKSFIKTRRK